MSRRTLDLSSLPWQLGRVERQPFSAQPADDRASVAEWLPAHVPGDVRADLIAAGRIPPVETPEGSPPARGSMIMTGGIAPNCLAV